MRVYFTYPITTLSGKRDETVFSSYNENTACVAREYVIPEYTDQNERVGNIATNLGNVYNSFDNDYLEDLRTYSHRANIAAPFGDYPVNFYANYSRMWWAVSKDDPTVDLKTVTFADIALLDIGIKTVKEAIDSGFLPPIAQYADLTNSYDGI